MSNPRRSSLSASRSDDALASAKSIRRKEVRILSVRPEMGPPTLLNPTFWWMPLYPVPQYYPQGKPMEGESRWES